MPCSRSHVVPHRRGDRPGGQRPGLLPEDTRDLLGIVPREGEHRRPEDRNRPAFEVPDEIIYVADGRKDAGPGTRVVPVQPVDHAVERADGVEKLFNQVLKRALDRT